MEFLYDFVDSYYNGIDRIRYGKSVNLEEIKDLLPRLRLVRVTIDEYVERELARLPWFKESELLSDELMEEVLNFRYDKMSFWKHYDDSSTFYEARMKQKGGMVHIRIVKNKLMTKREANGEPLGGYRIIIDLDGVLRE